MSSFVKPLSALLSHCFIDSKLLFKLTSSKYDERHKCHLNQIPHIALIILLKKCLQGYSFIQFQFSSDIATMEFNRFLRYKEFLADLFTGIIFLDEFANLIFSLG